LLTQVLSALIHVVAEEALQTVGLVAGTVVAVGAAALLVATDSAVAGDFVAEGLRGLAAPIRAPFSGDAVQNFGLGGATVRRNTIVRTTLTHAALARDVVARVWLAGAASVAVGSGQALVVGLARRRVDARPISADPWVTIGVFRAGVQSLTGVIVTADVPRNAIRFDRAEPSVRALAVVPVTGPEITDDALAWILLSTASQSDGAEKEGHT
jgi:hypothetical protein